MIHGRNNSLYKFHLYIHYHRIKLSVTLAEKVRCMHKQKIPIKWVYRRKFHFRQTFTGLHIHKIACGFRKPLMNNPSAELRGIKIQGGHSGSPSAGRSDSREVGTTRSETRIENPAPYEKTLDSRSTDRGNDKQRSI
jgi:hypothetical protein